MWGGGIALACNVTTRTRIATETSNDNQYEVAVL